MSFCGLRNPEKKALRRRQKGKAVDRGDDSQNLVGVDVREGEEERTREILRRKSADFEWAREDQLSAILEVLEERITTPNREKTEEEAALGWDPTAPPVPPLPSTIPKKTRFVEIFTPEQAEFPPPERRRSFASERSERPSIDWEERRPPGRAEKRSADWEDPENRTTQAAPRFVEWERKKPEREEHYYSAQSARRLYTQERVRRRSLDREERRPQYAYPSIHNMSERRTPELPRAIQPPPRDLESISRIDASLVFEHFTTNDAWELGSALRKRLLPISTPVVINISLANQDQTLFHTCTHTGVMPDNDSWVARKRKTVLRWGVSTWYMHCKFGGDEVAFREKYALGERGGEYAIHGGGVPIRVTGVEGVVAVVVVSGLAQEEDHGVIVEVIRELYY